MSQGMSEPIAHIECRAGRWADERTSERTAVEDVADVDKVHAVQVVVDEELQRVRNVHLKLFVW